VDTQVELCLAQPGHSLLQVFNSAGEKIKSLGSWQVEVPHKVSLSWDGRNEKGDVVASGLYIFYLQEPDGARYRKLLLVR
jgi:hypothetical protein